MFNVFTTTVTDEGVAGLCRSCAKLTTLYFGGCSHLTPSTLDSVAKHCGSTLASLEVGAQPPKQHTHTQHLHTHTHTVVVVVA